MFTTTKTKMFQKKDVVLPRCNECIVHKRSEESYCHFHEQVKCVFTIKSSYHYKTQEETKLCLGITLDFNTDADTLLAWLAKTYPKNDYSLDTAQKAINIVIHKLHILYYKSKIKKMERKCNNEVPVADLNEVDRCHRELLMTQKLFTTKKLALRDEFYEVAENPDVIKLTEKFPPYISCCLSELCFPYYDMRREKDRIFNEDYRFPVEIYLDNA